MSFQLHQFSVLLHQTPLFAPLDVSLEAGDIATVMGPSGSGKSTLLAAICGTLLPAFSSQGQMRLNGHDLAALPVEARGVGILFQDDLLFPHLDVYHNLAFALPSRLTKGERRSQIESALTNAGLSGQGKRDVATLSGGQRARVSLLRTLLAEPQLILLDEPFAKLDQTLRQNFRDWVFNRIRALGIPALLVTHDPADRPVDDILLALETPHA
ncbi:ATP-binding cassette domain-containing protein [Saccharospirillum mangrovi]|uniref:ATP-binding cassette domain-containing protein n=1 Tax=Saccharospirillum mangrovi TaxID=2161747 RepID=UPI000D3A64E2|nr:ATP-binding cassette domain-containing protein [Saccharospirillum mangrovi]